MRVLPILQVKRHSVKKKIICPRGPASGKYLLNWWFLLS